MGPPVEVGRGLLQRVDAERLRRVGVAEQAGADEHLVATLERCPTPHHAVAVGLEERLARLAGDNSDTQRIAEG